MVALTISVLGAPSAHANTLETLVAGQVTDAFGVGVEGAEIAITVVGETTPTIITSEANGLYGTLISYVACSTGTLFGSDLCVIDTGAPVREPGTCPQAADIFEDAFGCHRLTPPFVDFGCEFPYVESFGECKYVADLSASSPELLSDADCPMVFGATPTVTSGITDASGVQSFGACTYPPQIISSVCPGGSTAFGAECRVEVPPISGSLVCTQAGSEIVNNRCVINSDPNTPVVSITVTPPAGSDLAPATTVADVAFTFVEIVLVSNAVAAPGTFTSAPPAADPATDPGADAAAALINAGSVTNEPPLSTPDTVGTVVNGALQCSATGFTSSDLAQVTIDVPAATSLFIDHNAAMSIRAVGPTGTDVYSVSTSQPVTGLITAPSGTSYQMSLLFTTIFGSVMETPCSGPVTIG